VIKCVTAPLSSSVKAADGAKLALLPKNGHVLRPTETVHMARFIIAFCLALLACPVGSANAQRFNAQEQAEIRAVVRDYLVRNPEVLREALDALQARVSSEHWRKISADPRDFSIGPAGAPVTIVEFFDYRCPYCHAALEWVSDVARTRNDVRVVFKELPILGSASMEAARASIAAMPQGRYWAFHRALLGFQGDLTSERIDTLARQAGIDVARMRRAMERPDITTLLEDNRARAVEYELSGTPLFVINGEVVSGGFQRERLDQRVREAASEARARQQARR
jgi:protein-disulfide isomerase